MASRRRTLEAVVGLSANLLANCLWPGDDEDPEEGQVEPRVRDLELGIAWAAHELRGPLLTAKAGLDRAVTTASGRARRELLRQSSDELGQLAASIERLLSWGAGIAALDLTLADLTREVQAAVEDRAGEIDPTQLRIKAPARVLVRVDREQIRRAIANVVKNATKHARRGSIIRISVDQVGGIATVRVVNRGPAIRTADEEAIFKPFVRGRSPSRPGSGLGLFIAHRIVQAHRGAIRARSSGGWTTFLIELPAELSTARTRELEAGRWKSDSGPDRR
jgi:two-component system OmpR family sensor kinase